MVEVLEDVLIPLAGILFGTVFGIAWLCLRTGQAGLALLCSHWLMLRHARHRVVLR